MKKITIMTVAILLLGAVSTASFAGDDPVTSKPSFSGVLWASYWHAVSGGANNIGNGTANSFDIKRVYLTAAGNLAEAWSWKIIFEMGGAPQLNAFAKAAFIKWTIPGVLKQSVTFGLQPTLTWATTEIYWRYRIVMITPREYIGTTAVGSFAGLSTGTAADFGISYSLKPHEILNVSLMVANGSGHKTPEANMYKKIGLTAGLSIVKNGVIELYIETEGGASTESRLGIGLFAGYKVEKFGFGVDYFQKKFPDKTIYVDGAKLEVVSSVISFCGNYAVHEKLRLLGRFDVHTPIKEDKYLTRTFGKSGESLLIAGLDCSYGPPNTNFILTYQHKSYDAKYNAGSSWVERDRYSLIALDVAMKF